MCPRISSPPPPATDESNVWPQFPGPPPCKEIRGTPAPPPASRVYPLPYPPRLPAAPPECSPTERPFQIFPRPILSAPAPLHFPRQSARHPFHAAQTSSSRPARP